MSDSSPLVLSCKVRSDDYFHFGDSLRIEAAKPSPSPSRLLSIISRRTFGVCPSNYADKVVDSLQFEMHLEEDPALSHLTVRGEGAEYMAIHAVDRNLIVFDWCLPVYKSPVYLVYDAVMESLTMIPSSPWRLTPILPEVKSYTAGAIRVLVACLPGADKRSYALVRMAETTIYNYKDYKPVEKQDVLYVWRSSSPSLGWDLIRAEFPSLFKQGNAPLIYKTVLAFVCGSHAFWANTSRGIMYCRLDALLSARSSCHNGPKLMFRFINLPVELPDDPTCPSHVQWR
jgi:hypothetical protein